MSSLPMQHGPHRSAVQYALGWPRPHIEHITIARTGWNADADDDEAPPDIAYASARAFFFIAQLLVPLCQRASDSDGVYACRLTAGVNHGGGGGPGGGGGGPGACLVGGCGERATGAAGASLTGADAIGLGSAIEMRTQSVGTLTMTCPGAAGSKPAVMGGNDLKFQKCLKLKMYTYQY